MLGRLFVPVDSSYARGAPGKAKVQLGKLESILSRVI